MSMPMDLVLVRHGESEGNVAVRSAEKGDTSFYTEAFCARHSYGWRLTDRGKEQAKAAGEWIRANIGEEFDRYCCSEYVRAMETAALLGLPKARWYPDFNLRERDYGDIDVMAPEARMARYGDVIRRREIEDFFWNPPNGESMPQLCLRIDRVLDTLHRECEGKRVIIVCHGEVMWAFRVRLERMIRRRYRELDASDDPRDRVHNCQVWQYTRRDPATGAVTPYPSWFRSVCPTDLSLSHNDWERVVRPSFSNDELLAEAEGHPRLISGYAKKP